MTLSILSMRPVIETPTPRTTVETSKEKIAVSGADEQARRLAVDIGRGDEAAFRTLYERYHERLLRLALMLGQGDESLAQDAVQAAFVIAAAQLRRVQSESHLWNWLAQVARQQIAKDRRRQRDTGVVSGLDLPELAAADKPDSLLEEILDAALGELDDREIIERFYFDRLSHREIAERLGVTPKAVSSRLERAREKLRLLIKRRLSHET